MSLPLHAGAMEQHEQDNGAAEPVNAAAAGDWADNQGGAAAGGSEDNGGLSRQAGMKRKRTAFVWQYFQEQDKDKALCLVCNKVISKAGGSTSGLKRHLHSHNISEKRSSSTPSESAGQTSPQRQALGGDDDDDDDEENDDEENDDDDDDEHQRKRSAVESAAAAAAAVAASSNLAEMLSPPTPDLQTLLDQNPQVHVLTLSKQMKAVMTLLRRDDISRDDFVFFADRIARHVVEEGLSYVPYKDTIVATPTGAEYVGVEFGSKLCGVSIVRAGECMEKALQQCCRSIRIGKILIQRDEKTALPQLFYAKLPPDISERHVLLLDPMLATGGSALTAIKVLIEDHRVRESAIVFCNIVSCPEGLRAITEAYPKLKIVTAEVDSFLNSAKYIIPGCGDFGDRYYGTTIP